MTKRKVIEDSDDDDNAEAMPPPESPPATSEQTLTTITDDGASITAEILQKSASPSTASTERLNNEIRTAHKALIEPTPNSSLPSTRVVISSQRLSQASPTAARSKMRRTKTSVETSNKRKGLRTYGSQGRDIFEFCGGSDGEVDTPREYLDIRANKRLKSVEESKIGSTWVLGSGDTEVIEPRTSFTDKGVSTESSMPPPATKPTSFEQTQRSETSTVAMVLEPTPATPKPPGDTDSFQLSYSDGRMPTPTMSSRGRGDEANTTDLESAISSPKRSSTEIEFSHLGQPSLAEPNSTTPKSLPGKNVTVDTGTQPATLAHEVSELTEQPTTKPIMLLPQLQQDDDGQDELSLAISTSGTTSKNHVKPSQEKDQSPEQVDELGFDDTTLGLPTELYQPRPSKSRSGRENGQIIIPADYSKRPEAVAKKKRKLSRRKTTAFHELIPKEEYADDEDDIGISTRPSLKNPGPKAIEPIMEQDELGLEENDKAEEIHRDSEPEDKSTAKPTVSVKQRGRPKNGVGEAAESKSKSHDEPGPQNKEEQDEVKDTEADSGPEVEPKAPTKPNESKKQRGRPRKGAAEASNTKVRGKTPDELAQHEPTSMRNETTSLGRKPRNKGIASEAFKAVSEELVHDSEDKPLAADESENLSSQILCEIQGNVLLPKPTEGAPRSSSPSKSISAAPETPHKAARPHKGPDKHSPISSGKVAYRVGLSKRARIEPLLRIVRKC